MLMSFVGTIVLGLGTAGTWLLLIKALRLPVPGWTTPALAGLVMIVFHLYLEYSWFDRTVASMPSRAVVAEAKTFRNPLQPWTLIVPQVDRFSVVDTGQIRTHPEHPAVALAEVAFVERYYPTVSTTQLYDCTTPRRADILPTMMLGADGLPERIDWIRVGDDDPVRRVVCGEVERRRNG
ncbi:MAG: hypothetical protein EA356_04810 [Geminicoccaceae bacterium]|nr:MAG: hypothetical protein EA356_04810 [Geminicoccaceae bacterium]